VAESFRDGVRVVDVARRHGVLAHQLSDWRRQARQGLLALPEDAGEGPEASFVPLALQPEVGTGANELSGVVIIEIGDVVLQFRGMCRSSGRRPWYGRCEG